MFLYFAWQSGPNSFSSCFIERLNGWILKNRYEYQNRTPLRFIGSRRIPPDTCTGRGRGLQRRCFWQELDKSSRHHIDFSLRRGMTLPHTGTHHPVMERYNILRHGQSSFCITYSYSLMGTHICALVSPVVGKVNHYCLASWTLEAVGRNHLIDCN